jgi:uncharacterized protein
MKLSHYSKTYPAPGGPDSIILFSTKRASAVLVPKDLLADIEAGRLTEEERADLAELGLIVPSGEEERKEILSYIEDLNARDRSVKFIVVLNLDCNLACRYCFEGTRKGKHYLSDEVAARFIEFVRTRNYADKEEIRISFYGGEPLLSVDRIAGISGQIRSFAASRGMRYGFSLVTNGALLTPQVVKRLKPLGLTGAKVTLDGPKDVHDAFRPFRNGAGSFEVILRNIREVSDAVRIQIGGNYTQDNYRQFPRLLDVLRERGLGPDRIAAVKFDPVVNESSEFALPDFRDGCGSMDEPWVTEASVLLREEVLKRGYGTPKIMPSPCLMERDHSFVVNHDGVLYKCPGLIGRQGCAIGDVRKGAGAYRASHGLNDWKNIDCLACVYLPLCFGGCKYLKLIRDNNMRGVQCRKAYFDRVLGSLVDQDIRYGL